jgi:hypothetical protein
VECDYEGCDFEAVLAVRTLGEDDERTMCTRHLLEIATRLDAVFTERNSLIDEGVHVSMANHIMSARVDRKEV